MAKKSREQSIVSEVQGIENTTRRSEGGVGEAPPSRYDYENVQNTTLPEPYLGTFWNLSRAYCYGSIDPIFPPEPSR